MSKFLTGVEDVCDVCRAQSIVAMRIEVKALIAGCDLAEQTAAPLTISLCPKCYRNLRPRVVESMPGIVRQGVVNMLKVACTAPGKKEITVGKLLPVDPRLLEGHKALLEIVNGTIQGYKPDLTVLRTVFAAPNDWQAMVDAILADHFKFGEAHQIETAADQLVVRASMFSAYFAARAGTSGCGQKSHDYGVNVAMQARRAARKVCGFTDPKAGEFRF